MKPLFWVLTFLPLVLVGIGGVADERYSDAPSYEARVLDDQAILGLDDLAGSVVLLNIWATWCEPCREEMPDLQNLSVSYGSQGLQVIGVSIDGGGADERVRKFLNETGVTFTILRDEENMAREAFRTTGVPETLLISRDGLIVKHWKGPIPTDSGETRALIEQALAGQTEAIADTSTGLAGLAIPLALGAGLLSFLSPCVLPLVPTYIAVVAGVSLSDVRQPLGPSTTARQTTLLANGLAFVSGFSFVFITLGASVTAVGVLFAEFRPWIARIGGVVLIVLALHLLGIIRLLMLDREVRPHVSSRRTGLGGSFVIGLAFGAGWTPCIGPALASILTLTASKSSLSEGITLLVVYSLGLAIPFIIAALAIDRVARTTRSLRRWTPLLSRASGVLVLLIAVLLLTDSMTRLNSFFAGASL